MLDDKRYDDARILEDKLNYIIAEPRLWRGLFYVNLSDEAYNYAEALYKELAPANVVKKKKIKVGENSCAHDGSYVMLEPNPNAKDKILYSFGISTYAPFDLYMAKLGYSVYQYDGTVDKSPDEHPNIMFHQYNISGDEKPKENEKNITQILLDHNHLGKDIILQMDIEGAELDFFESITYEQISQFSQIIVEMHHIIIDEQYAKRWMDVLRKINKTHQVIHIHANNFGPSTILKGLRLLPTTFEVSYVRRSDQSFSPCYDEFPGVLDEPNCDLYPDIYLGYFNNPGSSKRVWSKFARMPKRLWLKFTRVSKRLWSKIIRKSKRLLSKLFN